MEFLAAGVGSWGSLAADAEWSGVLHLARIVAAPAASVYALVRQAPVRPRNPALASRALALAFVERRMDISKRGMRVAWAKRVLTELAVPDE